MSLESELHTIQFTRWRALIQVICTLRLRVEHAAAVSGLETFNHSNSTEQQWDHDSRSLNLLNHSTFNDP